jgi:phosphatidylglycerol:prolipoprotein diacylglycerol transferase
MRFNVYGFLIALGIFVALEIAKRSKIRTIEVEELERKTFWIVLAGIIGARIYHVLDLSDYYLANLGSVFKVWEGGLGIWGALIGGISAAVLLFREKKQLINLLDLAGLGLPLAQAIGRWGNYFNQEIVGVAGFPLYLSESILNLVLFGCLYKYSEKSKPGKTFGFYLIGYGSIRLFLEFFRQANDQWWIGTWPIFALFPMVAIITGFYFTWRKQS